MIAWITRLLLVLQFGLVSLLFYAGSHVWPDLHPLLMVAASVGIIFFIRIIITANSFILASRFQSTTPLDRQLTKYQAYLLFSEEFSATVTSSSWTMPFFCFHKRPAHPAVGLPVLLVHGYGCNSGYWHAMSRALTAAQVTHHAVDLEPVFSDIKNYVPRLHEAINILCEDSGHDRVIMVAHSMGGLVARAYLHACGTDRVAKVITLGTPHRGTGLANFGVGLNSQQMRWTGSATEGKSSSWLHTLQQAEGEEFYKLFVSIYSHHDNIVSPQTSSYLPGAVNIEVHGIGHVALALNATIQQLVVAEIRKASKLSIDHNTDINSIQLNTIH